MPKNANPEQDALFAAEQDADVSREKIAEVYAKALDGAVSAKGASLQDVLNEFDSFQNDILNARPKFEAVLSSAMIRPEDKIGIIERTVGPQASPLFLLFLKIVARRGRLDLLRDINRQLHLLNNKKRGFVPVTVTTATPLDDAAFEHLAAKLREVIHGEPQIRLQVDPDAVGGLIVRVGDIVYDASISTQLNKVRQQMIDRSAHEIQSRRDRFRNTEGN